MRFLVFGHAILEHALAPFKSVTAKALVLDASPDSLDGAALVGSIDERAAEHFARSAALVSTRTLQPLPVLGIPGWAPANDDPAFYDDTAVFRPGEDAAGKERGPVRGPLRRPGNRPISASRAAS